MRGKPPDSRVATGHTGPFSRFRRPGLWRAGLLPKWSKFGRWPITGWTGACFVLVALLAILQFEWINQVSRSQWRASRANLRAPVYGAIDQFQVEIGLLLWSFRPDADIDPSDRLRRYWESFVSWHALSKHGLAIRRILFYDTFSDGRRELTELVGKPARLKPASWDKQLAHARRHIDGSDMGPDSLLNRRWAVTWMFHPRAMALYRPIIRQDTGSDGRSLNGKLSGFLLLQLDLDFIRDQLIADILGKTFRRLSTFNRYTVSVTLDGKSLFIYDPVKVPHDGPGGALADFGGYSLRLQGRTDEPYEIGSPDFERVFSLSADHVTPVMARRGAVQRVKLRSRLDVLQLFGPNRVPPGMETGTRAPGNLRSDSRGLNFGWSGDLPRLLVIADAPYRVTLRSKREGLSIAEAVNRRYKRSVTMGILVLVLPIGAMAIVALIARRSAWLAAMRMEAAASQSHQLRNPLAGISLLADNMVRGVLGRGEKIITYGQQLREYGRQLNELVNRTVRLVAMDSPLRRYHLSMTDVSAVARKAVEQARPAIDGAGFTVECCCREGLPPVRADREALLQCLGELLANAVKYGLPGRWVRIETEEAGSGRKRGVRIRVCDRGQGMSLREARMVFEPFYRAPEVATSAVPGSGLGLTLARSTIEGMGGRLTLKSQPGHGSVFSIHFDVA